MTKKLHTPPLLPIGTRIVTRVEVLAPRTSETLPVGSVGSIISQPDESNPQYHIRFSNGTEADIARHEFSIYKGFQNQGFIRKYTDTTEVDYFSPYIIYRCVVGSTAFGLNQSESDVDRRGIYLPPAEDHWSLYGVPEQIERAETEEAYWELEKFLKLALKANPNILECLYTPLVEHQDKWGEELRAQCSIFLSKIVYQTYNGYVLSQFKKLEMDLRVHGAIRWKHAMHLIRLLISGTTLLKEGIVLVDVGEHRDRLLAVRNEEMSWEEVNRWRIRLHQEFDRAYTQSRLPERPDYEKANQFLIRARKSRVP